MPRTLDSPIPKSLHAALSKLDLNLLVTLDALLEARSVTVTAERFGVTQSAMSHRLARLRDFFDDPLLVPTGETLVLTPRAEAICSPLRDALHGLRTAVIPERVFDAAQDKRTFVLAAQDIVELRMLPTLLVELENLAPGITVRMAGRSAVGEDALVQGSVDIAIAPGAGTVPGVTIERSAGIRQRKLLTEGFAVLARQGHPRLQGSLTLKRYLRESHILVAPHGQPGSVVDARLAQEGKTRNVVAQVAHFLSAPFLVAETDHLLTCPTSLALAVKDRLGLQMFKPPLSLPSTVIFLYWHERMHNDPGHRWFREEIFTLTKRSVPTKG